MQTRLQIGRISTFLFRATANREDAKPARPRPHRGPGRRKIVTWCRIGPPPFVERVEGGRRSHPGKEET